MNILALETSCDETSASIVKDGTTVLGLSIASSLDLHKETGGVVPEVAAREHPLKVWPVIEEALQKSNLQLNEIDAIAATAGPGLLPALLTGYLTARTTALALDKPFIPVHHTLGHVYANWLEREEKAIQFPILVLTVSGGHNQLILFRDHFDFEIIGNTRDDAAGEAFDKVARLLELGYPGGPEISKAAAKHTSADISLPISWLNDSNYKDAWQGDNFDFSFSGLKSAVRRLVEENQPLTPDFIANVAHSFQESVTEVLSVKLIGAAEKHQAREVHLAGGVSANSRLREKIQTKLDTSPLSATFRTPTRFVYCTDNAAMIAACAHFQTQNNITPQVNDADPSLSLSLFHR